jgi:hypothetical protein
VARSRGKKLSESVRAAGRSGPADPADPTLCTQISQRDPFVLRFIIIRFPSHIKPLILQRRCGLCFPYSTRMQLMFLSFPSPIFELVQFPLLHPAVFFPFYSPLASVWPQKDMALLRLTSPVTHRRKGRGYLLLIS